MGNGADQRVYRDQVLASRLRDDGETYSRIAKHIGITKKRAIEYVKLGYRCRAMDELAAIDQELDKMP